MFPKIALLFVALSFLVAGVLKIAGVPLLHVSFAELGLPVWFGYFIGAAEVAGAVGLILDRTRILAVLGLAVIMIGAIYYHLTLDTFMGAIPAMLLMAILVFVLLTSVLDYHRRS